jgi:hypothetical protein
VGKIVDSGNKYATFLIWVVAGCVTVYHYGNKCLHRKRERRARSPGIAETGVALTTLNQDGHPRTVQFRVDSWEEERQNIRDVMVANGDLQNVVAGLRQMIVDQGRDISSLRQAMGVRARRQDTGERR